MKRIKPLTDLCFCLIFRSGAQRRCYFVSVNGLEYYPIKKVVACFRDDCDQLTDQWL